MRETQSTNINYKSVSYSLNHTDTDKNHKGPTSQIYVRACGRDKVRCVFLATRKLHRRPLFQAL
jgi:hypothetical protein